MSEFVVLSGSHPALVQLVQRRLWEALGDRLEFVTMAEARGTEATSTWLLLDPLAPRPAADAPRIVDWSLLGAPLLRDAPGSDDLAQRLHEVEQALGPRIDILRMLLDVPTGPLASEFHASLRVAELSRSVAFYAWLLNGWPREWTHRYATFVRPELALNFVLLVADGKELHHDTLYHLGIALADKEAVVAAYHRAKSFGARVAKPPRTTWRGTPLHELWLEDPDGTLVEVYARLTSDELAKMPADKEPLFLVPGTGP